ncbi:MAG: oligosaccharide flippase family protein [Bacteriodetes bacterium]|nr:oligosaccharide flippase family protein [Bacteroidota bacterium]
MSRFNTPLVRFITNTSALILADGLALVSSAVFVILLGRTYGAAQLGLLSYAMAFAAIAQTIVDSGYDITLPRKIGNNPQTAVESVLNSMSTKAMMSIIILPVAFISTLFIRTDAHVLTTVMLIDIIPTVMGYTYLTALRGLLVTKESSVIQGLYTSSIFIVCGLLVLLQVPLVVFTIVMVLGDTLKYFHLKKLIQAKVGTSVSISKVYKQHHSVTLWNTTLLYTAYREQKSLLITNILSSALVRVPTVFLGWYSTNVVVGEYAAAARFYSSLRIIPGAFFNAILPEYSNTETRSPKIKRVLFLSMFCAICISAILYVVAPLLIKYTFTYTASVNILQILSVGFCGLFLKTIAEAFLLAKHLEHLVNYTLLGVSIFAISAMLYFSGTSSVTVAWCVTLSEWALCIIMTIILLLTRSVRHPRRN